MKKILSIFAALLIAFAAYADIPSTDFSDPGYYCQAPAAALTGTVLAEYSSKFHVEGDSCIIWSDIESYEVNAPNGFTAVASWTFHATRACYISVSLDLGRKVGSNKHIFEVKLLDNEDHVLGTVAEGPAYTGDGFTDSLKIKALDGKILIPAEGDYTVELRNNRDWCKGSLKKVILSYAGEAPITDFSTPYSCKANDVTLTGTAPAAKFYVDKSAADPDDYYIVWSDIKNAEVAEGGYTYVASWQFQATRACCVSVALDLGTAIGTNKHIFEVKLLDESGDEVGAVEEGPAFTGDGFTESDQVKSLDGIILIPAAGNYTLQVKNNRNFCKGSIKKVTLTAHEYTVAGNNTAIFGTAWAPTNTDNDMVYDNGLLSFTKENVPLAAGDVKFKVVENHDWNVASYPADDYVYNIASAGFYNFGITFNPNTEEINVEATLIPATEYKTLYFQATYDWWKWDIDGATAPGLYAWQGDVTNAAWPGAQMQPVEGEEDIWSIQIDARLTNIIFTRLLASTGAYKGVKTIDLTVPTDGKDQYTLTKETYDWGNDSEQLSEEDGVWGVFTPYVPTLANGYYLIGCINGVTNWTVAGLTSDQLLSVNPENDAEYIIKTTLAQGDQFKVVNVQHDKGKNWYPDGSDNNYIVDANHDGLMDVYFRPAGGQAGWHEGYIYATPAPYVRKNAVANKWGTICLPWNATIENAKAYYIGTEITVAPAQDATVVVEEVVADGELYAGKTYLIKAIADGDITANFNLNANKKTSPEYYNNLMGNLEATPATILASDASYDYYILSENAFHHLEGTASATVAQYKGYLRVAKSQGAPGLLRIVEAENQATSIEGLDANETATKFIENGKLYILRDGVVYDAMGKMVK